MLNLVLMSFVSVYASPKATLPSFVAPKVEAHFKDVPLERVHEIQKTVDKFEVVEQRRTKTASRLGTNKTTIQNRFISDDGKSSGLDTSVMTERPDGTTEVRRKIKWIHPEEQRLVKTKAKATLDPDGAMTVKAKFKKQENVNFRGVSARVTEKVTFESQKHADGKSSSESNHFYQLRSPNHRELNMTMKEQIEFKDESKPGTYRELRRGQRQAFKVDPPIEK